MRFVDLVRKILGRSSFLKEILMPINNYLRRRDLRSRVEIFNKNKYQVFEKVYDLLSEENIEFWPEFGTLLGIYRENDFLKHDYDFDFGTFVEYSQHLKEVLLSSGYTLIRSYNCKERDDIEEFSFLIEGINVDFFIFNHTKETDNCYTFEIINDKIEIGEICKIKEFSFAKITLEDHIFRNKVIQVPSDIVNHLSVSYGPGFMTPDPNFKSINHNYLNNCTGFVSFT